MSDASDRRFLLMLQEAKDRVLYVSPPYSSTGAQKAFLAGYDAALMDIARGNLKSRTGMDPSKSGSPSHAEPESAQRSPDPRRSP